MSCEQTTTANPIERFIGCFDSVEAAALAAGVSRERLRQMRHAGFVTTRDRAITMALACKNRVRPAALLALPPKATGAAA